VVEDVIRSVAMVQKLLLEPNRSDLVIIFQNVLLTGLCLHVPVIVAGYQFAHALEVPGDRTDQSLSGRLAMFQSPLSILHSSPHADGVILPVSLGINHPRGCLI
jgi:hypothetical protein